MKRLLERCAVLDVHKKQLTICVRLLGGGGEVEELMAECSTMPSQLLALRDWLKELGVTHVAMEASGVSWKAPYYALEDDCEVLLVNGPTLRTSPGGAPRTRSPSSPSLDELRLDGDLVRATPTRELSTPHPGSGPLFAIKHNGVSKVRDRGSDSCHRTVRSIALAEAD